MPKKEAPLAALRDFIPDKSVPFIFEYLRKYKVHLTITKSRKSVLGDYRHAFGEQTHRISVNGNLNKYSFLITLIHELAHLVTFIQFNNRVLAHGKEWKNIYRNMLLQFMSPEIFPSDITHALERSLHNLPASSCADENLTRALKKYDDNHHGLVMVEQVKEGTLFEISGGKIFKKGKQLRKCFQCEEVKTGKVFLFSPVYEVKLVSLN
jgi:SprT protein